MLHLLETEYLHKLIWNFQHRRFISSPHLFMYSIIYLIIIGIAAAAAAKSLQSCPTLCSPIDGSPPGSPVPGILQARTPEWVAISFSNAWKWKVKVKSLSRVYYRYMDVYFILWVIIQYYFICSIAQIIPNFNHWGLFYLAPMPPLKYPCPYVAVFLTLYFLTLEIFQDHLVYFLPQS